MERPPYPTGDVVGPCVCGSWPGGPCLKCEWIPEPPLDHVPLFLRDLSHLVGTDVKEGVTLLTAPRWDVKTGRWSALANCFGMLAIIELRVREIT